MMPSFSFHPFQAAPKIILCGLFALILLACSQDKNNHGTADGADQPASPYLVVFAGDQDEQDSDFVMIMDVDPSSETRGTPVSSLAIGHKASMPHHMEYVAPPKGEAIFMNAHHHELSMLVDVSDPQNIAIEKMFKPPAPLRFPHDYTRTPEGNRLVGFLRSEGDAPTRVRQHHREIMAALPNIIMTASYCARPLPPSRAVKKPFALMLLPYCLSKTVWLSQARP